MQPWLEIPGLSERIPLYPLLIALAFSVGYWNTVRTAVRANQDWKMYERLFVLILFASWLGGRLFYVLFSEFSFFRAHPGEILKVWQGGSVFYGSLFASIFSVYLFARWKQHSFAQLLDTIAPSLLLGVAVGRLGCLFAGCCWGSSTDVPWAVTYRSTESLSSLRDTPIHPAPLYESVAAMIAFLILHARLGRIGLGTGRMTIWVLGSYACIRLGVEFFRADPMRGFVLENRLSTGQFLSLSVLGVCAAYAAGNLKRDPKPSTPDRDRL